MSLFAPSKKALMVVTECNDGIREARYLHPGCLQRLSESKREANKGGAVSEGGTVVTAWGEWGGVSDRMLIAICGTEQINSTEHIMGLGHIRTPTPTFQANVISHLTATSTRFGRKVEDGVSFQIFITLKGHCFLPGPLRHSSVPPLITAEVHRSAGAWFG